MLFKVTHCTGCVVWSLPDLISMGDGDAISCTKCCQVAGFIHKVSRSSSKISSLCAVVLWLSLLYTSDCNCHMLSMHKCKQMLEELEVLQLIVIVSIGLRCSHLYVHIYSRYKANSVCLKANYSRLYRAMHSLTIYFRHLFYFCKVKE